MDLNQEETAMDRLQEHPDLEGGIARIVRALATDRVEQLTCEDCEGLLPAYVQAEAEDQADEARWGPVTAHIETCPRCLDAYAELSALVEFADGVQGTEPPIYPVPDLSFLPNRRAWYEVVLDWGKAWLEHGTEKWRQVEVSLPAPGNGIQRAPALSGLMGEIAGPHAAAQLTVAPEASGLEVRLVVTPEAHSQDQVPSRYRLDVALTVDDRFGDFSGAHVTLSCGDTARTETTDALGKVSFGGLSGDQLDTMRLTVTLPDG